MEPILNRFGPLLVEQLREQLNNLMAATQLLTPAIREQEDRRYDQYLAILNQSLYKLLRLMNNLEYAQRLEGDGAADAAALRPTMLDVAGLCRDLAEQVTPLARQAGVRFFWEEEKSSLLMMGDAALLRRMLLNLISNALRAAGEGGEAGLRLGGVENRAIITLWDKGDGTALPGAQEELYDDALAHRREGLCLGLLIARQIAVLHGGTIVFERRENRGVRAVVSLDATLPKQTTTILHTPRGGFDASGGFSPVLVELSGVLPFDAFLPADLE